MITTGFKTFKVSLIRTQPGTPISQTSIDAAKRLIAMKMTSALDAEWDHVMNTGALDRISPESTDIIAEYRIIVDDEDIFDDSTQGC